MKKSTSGSFDAQPQREWGEGADISLRAVHSPFASFQDANHAYNNGTDEVRRLLLYECSLIYECNVCRNLFRSLSNFISHKRINCCASSKTKSNSGPSDRNASVIPAKRRKNSEASAVYSLAVDVNGKVHEHNKILNNIKSEQEDTEVLKNNSNSMQQQGLQRTDTNKTKPDTLNQQFKIKVEGCDKSAPSQNRNPSDVVKKEKISNNVIDLDKMGREKLCQLNLNVKELLELNIKKKQCTSTFVFRCPKCILTFTQPNDAIRHLANVHKHPECRRRLREISIKNDDKPKNVEERTLTKEIKKKKRMSNCSHCKKTYERGDVLTSHTSNCRSNQQLLNKLKTEQLCDDGDNNILLPTKKEETIKLENDDTDTLNEMFANLGQKSFSPALRTVSFDKLENVLQSDCSDVSLPVKTESTAIDSTASPPPKVKKKRKMVSPSKCFSCCCKICNKAFNAISNVRRHISMFHYRARRFGCTICEYRAFRRYDIVNHLGYVHKMEGDREQMSAEYVSVHEVNYTKEDVDSDIIVITDGKKLGSLIEPKQKSAKASKLDITKDNSLLNESTAKRNHLKRARSHLSPGGGKDAIKVGQKRPIRNRIKAVNKDFVYDLSDLVKKEHAELNNGDEPDSQKRSNDSTILQAPTPLVYLTQKEHIKGTVQRIAKLLVIEGRAALATMPELPSERPQMRTRRSGETQPISVIEPSDIEAACMKSNFLSDTFLENCTMFKMKPSLASQAPYSALNSLFQKVDLSLHNNASKTEPSYAENGIASKRFSPDGGLSYQNVVSITCNTEVAHVATDNIFVDPEPSIPISSSPPPTPRKRSTLVKQHLPEDYCKQHDSLLRSALED